MDAGHEQEFRRLFEIEATQQLDRLADTVLELERAGSRPELVATLFRDAHTLKSSASLVGLHGVSGVAHRLEDLLGELRSGARVVTPGLAGGILDVVDALRGLIAAGLAGLPDAEHAAAAEAGLRRAATPGSAVPPAPSETERTSTDETFRRLFADEVGPELERLTQTALEVERRGAAPELVAALFRGAHSLKGSAAVVGFADVAALAHLLEDRLDELRAGLRPPSAAFVDAVLAALDAVRAATPALVAGQDAAALLAPGRSALVALGDAPPPVAPAAPGVASAGVAPAPVPVPEAAAIPEEVADPAPEGEPEPLAPEIVRPPLLRRGDEEPSTLAPAIVRPPALRGPDVPRAAPPAPPEPAPVAASPPVVPEPVAASVAAPPPVLPEPAPTPVAPPADAPAAPEVEPVAAALPASPPEVEPAAAVIAPTPPAPPAPGVPGDRHVSVGLDHLDGLVRLSGEAVAAQLRLTHLLREHIAGDPAAEAAALELRRALAGVQEGTMRTRMTSLEGIAANLRRAARDVARASGKEVDYALAGERVELDRAVLDGLRDPLLHLVRNAVDHGLETPAVREARGKPRVGTVRVAAERRGPEIVVTVTDDGAGLDLDALRRKAGEHGLDDRDAAALVFRPGLSTAGAVTDISGRGVGLDAVRTAVEQLRGRVTVESRPGAGCRFTVFVPLTLAVVTCVLLEVAGERYHVPSHATVTIADGGAATEVGLEGGAALWVGGDIVPLSSLADVLGTGGAPQPGGPAVVLEGSGGLRHAFRVDAVLGQRGVTVKELGAVVPRSQLVAGASIEADGAVVLVLDASALVEATGGRRPIPPPAAPPAPEAPPTAAAPTATRSILVVDDAMTVRELERSILERAGYAVRVAVDGEDALARLAEARPDLVVTDVEMPRLDGYGLAAAIRARPGLESLPVLMVTSRAGEHDRRRGLDAGADAYLVKQEFDAQRLLDAVARLLGA